MWTSPLNLKFYLKVQSVIAGFVAGGISIAYVYFQNPHYHHHHFMNMETVFTVMACAGLTAAITALVFGKSKNYL